jgi:hypothetical protein
MKTVNVNATAEIRNRIGAEYAIRTRRRHVPSNDMFMDATETSSTLRKIRSNLGEERSTRSCFCSAPNVKSICS